MTNAATIPDSVHFIGIGGVGQRATAELLLDRAVAVSGSDVQDSAALRALAARGASVHIGHAAANLGAARLVVVSSAVPEDNPEIVAARQADIEVVKNAELERRIGLGKRTLAVAGTHGKTTTTSMLAWVCDQAGLGPSFVVGGEARNFGVGGRAGSGALFVVEADEYDRRFLRLDPWCAIVTNVEADHLDYYGTFEAMVGAFRAFVGRVPPDGLIVLCADDPGAAALASAASAPVAAYGIDAGDWRATDIVAAPEVTEFAVWRGNERVAKCRLTVPGRHNVRNALACVAVGDALGISPTAAAEALGTFLGARRRFELVGEAAGIAVISDYGHLPAEVSATVAAARQRYPGRRVWAIFQPHTYARTRLWLHAFAAACREADAARIVGAYVPPGREMVQTDEETRALADNVGVPYWPNRQAIGERLPAELRAGDVVLLIGAGDINLAADPLLTALGRNVA